MCGATIKGAPKTVRIEGAELDVCHQCMKYGTEVQQPKRPDLKRRIPDAGPQKAAVSGAPQRRKRDVFDYIEGEIVEDYAERIRRARMERNWTQKDLAMQIKEREILIKKIEKRDLIPEDELRKKLEKTLNIRLIDMVSEETGQKKAGSMTPTLGDLISIKRSTK
jgi:putative transcription factor